MSYMKMYMYMMLYNVTIILMDFIVEIQYYTHVITGQVILDNLIITILMTAYSKTTCLTFSVHCNQMSVKSSAHFYSKIEL